MKPENDFYNPVPPKKGEARKLLIISITLMVTLPTLIGVTAFQLSKLTTKTEIESLESAIRSVDTQIKERNDCDENIQGYYNFQKEEGEVVADEIVICTNNFSYAFNNYANLLKHEMTHIMHACLGTTINSPDEIRALRKELKERNEKSYRTIHGAYSENNHFMEVEARWMELQDYKYVNNQLQKYCGSGYFQG